MSASIDTAASSLWFHSCQANKSTTCGCVLTGQITTAQVATETWRRPINTILAWEEEAILQLFDEWGPLDRSHRKLAHRGSYLKRVFVSVDG